MKIDNYLHLSIAEASVVSDALDLFKTDETSRLSNILDARLEDWGQAYLQSHPVIASDIDMLSRTLPGMFPSLGRTVMQSVMNLLDSEDPMQQLVPYEEGIDLPKDEELGLILIGLMFTYGMGRFDGEDDEDKVFADMVELMAQNPEIADEIDQPEVYSHNLAVEKRECALIENILITLRSWI